MTPVLMTHLVEAALRALAAATAVWASLRILRVKNLVAQKAAWAMVLTASLAMPLLMGSQWTPAWADLKLPAAFWASGVGLTTPHAAAAVDAPVSGEPKIAPRADSSDEEQFPSRPAATIGADDQWSEVNESAPAAARGPAQSATPARTGSLGHTLLVCAWALYLGGSAVLLSRLLWGLATSLGIWLRADRVELAADLDFPSSIRVGWSDRVQSPVNIGSGILLPADHGRWSQEKLRVVLAHERSHIQQGDFYLQLLAGFYAALTWFSPLGWWLKHKLSELGEAISDRAGLEAAPSASTYAGMLLEFAALPRPTLNGVGMAHSSNLSDRIERFLNESNFRAAFAGGRRALLTLTIPAMLIATSAFVRVEAATAPVEANSAQNALAQADSSTAITGQANPQPAQVTESGPAPEPAATPVPASEPAPPMPPAGPSPEAAPVPPPPQPSAQEPMPKGPGAFDMPAVPPMPPIHVDVKIPPIPRMAYWFRYEGACFPNGDGYVIVGDPGSKPNYCGNWDNESTRSDVEKARSMEHGHFLLFRHEGKLYIFDDPATMSQIEEMEKSQQDVGEQMRALGKQMREGGEQMREQGRIAREAASKIQAPDLSKEIAELNASAASLKAAQDGTVSREQLQQVQHEVSEIQRRLIQAEIGVDMKNFNAEMGKFSEEQGKLGGQMGKLGAQMGQLSRENSQKIQSIIDQSLKDGKAKPLN